MRTEKTTGILLERVVKSIVAIDNKLVQTIAFEECMQATRERHPPCLDLVKAVHKEVSKDVVDFLLENSESFSQWAEFQRCLKDYMDHKLYVDEKRNRTASTT